MKVRRVIGVTAGGAALLFIAPIVAITGVQGTCGTTTGLPVAAGGTVVTGPVSTFGPPSEPAHATALGKSSADAGISLRIAGTTWDDPRNRALLGHLFRVVIAGHSADLEDIDLGPNQWTGRDIDVTGQAAIQMGLLPFPTGTIGSATELAGAVPVSLPVVGAMSACAATGAPNIPTGQLGAYSSPFVRTYTATVANVDMGVDFGMQQGISPGDPILAIGDCYLRRIDPAWYAGQPTMFLELADKTGGYWGFYLGEEITPALAPGPALIRKGTVVARFASGGSGIEFGWAASATQTASQAHGTAGIRHAGGGTPDGLAFLAFLKATGAVH